MMTGFDMADRSLAAAREAADEYFKLLTSEPEGQKLFGHLEGFVKQVSINSFLRGVHHGLAEAKQEVRREFGV